MADATAIIDAAQGFAADAAQEANAALLEVQNAINAAGFAAEFETEVDFGSMLDSVGQVAEELIADLAEATVFEETLEKPTNPFPMIDPLGPINDPDIETSFGKAPGLSLIGLFETGVPAAFDEDPPTEPPGVSDTFPTIGPPTIDDLGPPNLIKIGDDLTEFEIPKYEQRNPFPIFDEKEPDAPPDPPEKVLEKYEAAYNRMIPQMKAFIDGCIDEFLAKFDPNHQAHMNNLNERIDLYLQGGSGFNAQVEQAIYDRGRGRVHVENRAAEQAAWDQIAAKGYSMPQGLLNAELRRSANDGANRNGQLAMDVVRLQGELEQKNLQFAVQQSIALRTATRNASIQYAAALLQINRDALTFAQQFVDVVVRVYELQVRAWQSSIEYLRARISLFEARLQAALADVQIFEAKIRALGVITEVNKAKVELYQQQVEVEKTKIELFAAKIQAQNVEIQRRLQLIEIFKGQVQGYSARVAAKDAEFQAYAAAINGDRAIVDAQIAKVTAYQAKVAGITAANEAKLSVSTAQAENNRAIVDKFRAEMDGWIQEYKANEIPFNAKLAINQQEIEAYAAMARNQVSQRGLILDYNRAIAEVNSAKANAEARAHLGTMQGKVGRAQATIEGATSAARTAAGIATGALSAQNTLVQVATVTQG